MKKNFTDSFFIAIFVLLNKNNDMTMMSNDIRQMNTGMLDRISQNDPTVSEDLSGILFPNVPNIYAFTTSFVPNAVKVGFTTKPVRQRIDQWKEHYPVVNLIGSWSAAVLLDSVKYYIKDYPVHKEIIRQGFRNLSEMDFSKDIYFSKEFFSEMSEDREKYLTEMLLTEIINTVKANVENGDSVAYGFDTDEKSLLKEPEEFSFEKTQLQQDAVSNGVRIYKSGENKMLLAAVMRFGKTHVGYSIVNDLGLNYVLVVSAKVNTKDEWRNGIYHSDFKNFVFVEYKDSYTLYITDRIEKQYKREVPIDNFDIDSYIARGKRIIVFASVQDLSGIRDSNNSDIRIQKAKHEFIFNRKNDMIIVDETHYGVRGASWSKTFTLKDDDYDKDSVSDKKEIEKLDKIITGIPTVCQFHMSGTPYYIMTSHEFAKNQIVGTYSYLDMLNARDNWITENPDTEESESPYFGIPDMIRFAMKLTKKCSSEIRKIQNDNNLDIDMSTLFKCEGSHDTLKFCYEEQVTDFMQPIFGGNGKEFCGFLNYCSIVRGEIFKHIVCKLPTIKACHALKKLLIEKNIIDDNREIIVAVDNKMTDKKDSCTETAKDLNSYLNKLESDGKKSITLTVQRLMTGATIPYWDSMFYMSDTESPQEYDQNIFRICSRNVKNAKSDGQDILVNAKPYVYLIDFKINRMFRMTCDSARLMITGRKDYDTAMFEESINANIEKMPIYVDFNSAKMDKITATDLMKFYVRYDKESTIEDIILDGLENYEISNFDDEILGVINRYSGTGIQMNKRIDAVEGSGQNEIPVLSGIVDNNTDTNEVSPENSVGKKIFDKKEYEELKKKLTSLLKSVLYLVICIDVKVGTLNEIINHLKNNSKDYNKAKIFLGEDCLNVLNILKNNIGERGKAELEEDIFRLSVLLNDSELSERERFEIATKKIGKLDKNEIVTAPDICEKMIGKLDQSKFINADKILEVNSKVGEFIKIIYNKFGIEVAKKITIIPSSNTAREFIKKFLRILKLDESQCLDITANEFLDANMGKFDIVLMNPPYDRDLHLKFLKKAIEVGEDVVSVQPIRWIKEVVGRDKKTSRYNKYKNSISDHIVELESIDPEKAKHIFNITYNAEIGIYVCNKIGGFDYDAAFENLIITKVLNYIKHNYCIIDIEKQDGYRVRMPLIVQGKCRGSGDRYPALSSLTAYSKEIVFKDGKFNNKWWHEYYAKNHLSKTTDYITHSIKFNSEEEGLNFIRSLETDFGRYVESILITDVNVNNKKILWMGNAVNPRTGLLGYKGEWTSEDFEKFFNLTEDEIKLYRDHIEAFKIKRAKWFKDRNKIDKMTWEER